MGFVNVVVPVIIIAGVGFIFARLTRIDTKPLTQLSFYILSPVLIFHSLLNRSISMSDLSDLAVFVLITQSLLTIIGALGVRWTGWDADSKASAMLSLTFNNCGNYGLAILLFAFGDAGFTLGVLYMIVHVIYQIVVGVGIASWRKGMKLRNLVVTILKVPWLYAVLMVVAVRLLHLEIPTAIARPVELVAGATIPIQLLLLGISLSRVRLGSLLRQAVPISLAKLILPPLLAWGLTALLGIEGLLRAVLILQASTPTAVNALILSLQYERRSELTASVVLITTVGALGVTSLLLWLLV